MLASTGAKQRLTVLFAALSLAFAVALGVTATAEEGDCILECKTKDCTITGKECTKCSYNADKCEYSATCKEKPTSEGDGCPPLISD